MIKLYYPINRRHFLFVLYLINNTIISISFRLIEFPYSQRRNLNILDKIESFWIKTFLICDLKTELKKWVQKWLGDQLQVRPMGERLARENPHNCTFVRVNPSSADVDVSGVAGQPFSLATGALKAIKAIDQLLQA